MKSKVKKISLENKEPLRKYLLVILTIILQFEISLSQSDGLLLISNRDTDQNIFYNDIKTGHHCTFDGSVDH